MTKSYAEPTPAAPSPFAAARTFADETERALASEELLSAPHSAAEAYVNARGREWARLALEAQYALRAARERRVEVVGADAIERGAVRESERHIETLVGTVAAPRLAYQQAGHADLHPMDAMLNLPTEDSFSHGVRRMAAMESASGSFEEVVDRIRDYTGAKVAKRQVELLANRAAQDFDAFYELRRREREMTTDLLVISTDGKGVVVRREDLREATRKRAEESTHKVETRLTPGEKRERKRMAQVGTVYTVPPWERTAADILHSLRDEESESQRPRPRDKRVFASVAKAQRAVIREAFDEALRRDPERRRRWVVLVDGDAKQLKSVKAEARRVGVTVTIVADIVHVLEYVWKAARAIFGETSPEAENWVGDRFLALLTGRTGGGVAATIRYWAKRRSKSIDASARKAITKACAYLANRTRVRLMHYADYLADGLPISTGVIEGACRYLVKDRMDRTGARWSLAGAEAVLRLRALRASGDFDDYWHFHLAREPERNHAVRYANAEIPNPLPARHGHLRLVK